VTICVHLWLQIKSHARNYAWLTLAPFGGITRIRFKGSAPKSLGALSAKRLPRTFFRGQNKTGINEVNAACAPHSVRCAVQSAISFPLTKLLTKTYPAGVAVVSCFIFVWKMASH